MSSIFSKIISGEIPSYKIYEDNKFYAFLDINPLKEGHTLVVPKEEVDYIFDLDNETIGDMMVFAKKVSVAIKLSIPCLRVGVAIIGLEVPHAHIHLVPLTMMDDINFSKPKLTLEKEKMKEIATKIASHIN